MKWIDAKAAEYPICYAEGTTIKTIIRSNPGLLLIKNGVIINKWGRNDMPDEYKLNGPLENIELGQMNVQTVGSKIFWVIMLYLLPLILISFVDRLWVGSQYYMKWKEKRKQHLKTN